METQGHKHAAQYTLRGRKDLIPQEGLDRVALLVDLINDPGEDANDKSRYEAELFGWENRLYALEALTDEEWDLISKRETTIKVYERGMDIPRDIRRPVIDAALWAENGIQWEDQVGFDLWLQTWLWKEIPKPVAEDWMVKAIMWARGLAPGGGYAQGWTPITSSQFRRSLHSRRVTTWMATTLCMYRR